MTSVTCLCTPLLCDKCPNEYKSLTQLKNHLKSKYKASKRQTLTVSQKHLDLQINCSECIDTDHATGKWMPSICFPTDKVLQDHMEVAHKILNTSKSEQNTFGSQIDTCSCVKAFQCQICPQSYYESSCLEKHWQESGHQPENKEALLSDLQSTVTKVNCKKCFKCTQIKRNGDVCVCREMFICSVCLSTFSCYPTLKKHWKMTNYHSEQDSQDVLTETKGEDCSFCKSQETVNCAYPKEKETDNICSNRDAPDFYFSKDSSPDAFQQKSDQDFQHSKQHSLSKDISSHSLNQMMANDTDTDNGSDVEDIENISESYKKRKKETEAFCRKQSNYENVKEKKVKINHSHEEICDINSADDVEKMEFDKSFLSDIPEKIPSTSTNCNKDASKAIVSDFHSQETTVFTDSPVIVIKDAEDDHEANDVLVTITIFEKGSNDSKENLEVERSSSKDPFNLKSCFQQCLQLASMDCICASSSRKAVAGTKSCSAGCLQMNCFMCSSTYSSYIDLKEHFIKDHSLQHNIDELSNPSPEYVEIMCKQLEMLDCSCTDFKCEQCKLTFKQRLPLLHHNLLSHPQFYPAFSPLAQRGKLYSSSCPQCRILEKLCEINYYLFIRVLLEIESCSDEIRVQLLKWCPSYEPFDKIIECNSENMDEAFHQEGIFDSTGDTKVVCYSVTQQGSCGKVILDKEKRKHSKSVECICPLLKCPDCPKTSSNFGDLRKHARLNKHKSWNEMRLLWKKYKAIKENCPSCCKFSYAYYVLCPHCPHLSFEDEDKAKAHMDSLHERHNSESETTCTCSKHFLCMTCGTYYHTPQGLYHHMRQLGHETQENFDAVPGMIKEKIEDMRKCAQCSLFMSSKVLAARNDEEQCSCKWAACNTCGSSFKKISFLIYHMRKMKHPLDLQYIERERQKLNASFKSCQKCNSMKDQYCIFCNTRENSIYHHIKTHHQDQQILILNGNNYELKDEYDTICENKDFAKYECSICLKRFLLTSTLRHHVQKIHPDCYFTLLCLDLSNDSLKKEDIFTRKEIRILAIVSST